MKNRWLYMMCVLVAAMVQACTNEVDDLFDTPASERVNEDIKACRELLISSEYGWKLDYYPSNNQAYGGFAMTVKFDNHGVTAASEISSDVSETYSSLYSMKADRGTTLNFDTYNPILHYFADPDLNAGGGLGKGYEGDYEFIIMSHDADEIVLSGKKTRNVMRMTRLTEPSENYLKSVVATREEVEDGLIGALGFQGTVSGTNASFTILSSRRMTMQSGETLETVPYMYTSTGIRFYQPVEIGGKEVASLEWVNEGKTFKSESGPLERVIDEVYVKYERFLGDYTMNYYYGNNLREVSITLAKNEYSASSKSYVVDGLPFPLVVFYNVNRDCMELLTYNTGMCNVAMWEVTGNGTLSWGPGLGMVGLLKEGTDNVYEFVDNGVWKSNIARALILWHPNSGEYKGYGGDTRFQYITFTKE